MKRRLVPLRAARAALLLLCPVSCAEERHDARYEFVLRVQSDPGRPLAGAIARVAGKSLGTSRDDGTIRIATVGSEGSRLAIDVSCPEGHRSPSEPTLIVLRAIAELGRTPEYTALCPPLKRKVVVAVRLDGAPYTPILQLGKQVARADQAGAAHVLLESVPEETLELTVDTAHNPALRPRSPTSRFKVGSRDEVVILNQSFATIADKPAAVARAKPTPTGPVRIR